MYYNYNGKTNKLFKHGQICKMYYIKKYDCYVCVDNLKILKPEELKSDFRVLPYSYIIMKGLV